MAKTEYTQTVKPVSRIPEKIFGWLAWVSLFGVLAFSLYSLLVSGNDPAFKSELERQILENPDLADLRQIMDENGYTVATATDALFKLGWILLAYLAVPLVLGLIGLLTMGKRILSGILLLLAGLFTLPIFVLFWIPLFFFIAAILMFARKDKVTRNEDTHYDNRYDSRSDDRYDTRNERVVTEERVEREPVVRNERADNYTYDSVKENKTEDLVVEDSTDSNVTIDRETNYSNDDRVTYVDKTKDATQERRDNYNERMNNKDNL